MNTLTFAELIDRDPKQIGPFHTAGAVSIIPVSLRGRTVYSIADGEYLWLCGCREFRKALKTVDPSASNSDWYSAFCSITSHLSSLEKAYERKFNFGKAANWP
jgi:hypothetical protein